MEIGLGDGATHRFGPGHVTLAEDLTGKGHTTRVVGKLDAPDGNDSTWWIYLTALLANFHDWAKIVLLLVDSIHAGGER